MAKGLKQRKKGVPSTGRASTGKFGKSDVANTTPEAGPPSRVLYIPETLKRVFSYLDRSDNVRNARVCKVWSDPALAHVWDKVDDLRELFSVLTPLVRVGQLPDGIELYGFAQLPSSTDWKRFEKTASFVRTLSYRRPPRSPMKLLGRHAIMDISLTRPRPEILPNMNTLMWSPHASSIAMFTPTSADAFLFMHRRVTTFKFSLLTDPGEPYITQYLHDIPLRMPCLTTLDLHTARSICSLEDNICRLGTSLLSVTTVRLPAYFLTSRIVEALSSLPFLRVVEVGYEQPEIPYPDNPALVDILDFPPGRFPSLANVALRMHLADATKLANVEAKQGGLQVFINQCLTGTPEEIQEILEVFGTRHSGLHFLELSRIKHRYPLEDLQADPDKRILFANLQPLSRLSKLTTLELEHPSPIWLSLGDAASIVSSLPLLTNLIFNPAPFSHQTSCLGLDLLPTIAKHCRNLVSLAVFIDATQPASPLDAIISPELVPFPTLTSLSIGVSLITKETSHNVALYLSNILPSGCILKHGGWWLAATAEADGSLFFKEANARAVLWEEVVSLLQLLAKARLYDRARPRLE